ncbi:MAG: formylglycine-generating enzyme family protein [Phormidesmis sp.]
MIGEFIELLQTKALLLSDQAVEEGSEALPLLQGEDLADMLWLADKIGGEYVDPVDNGSDDEPSQAPVTVITDSSPATAPPAIEMTLPPAKGAETPEKEAEPARGVPIQVQAAPALQNRRELARALRPLMRKVPSRKQSVLDAVATVNRIAERRIWVPVLKPAPERWFDLELVIEASAFSFIWQDTLDEFQHLLEWQGAFRRVRAWVVEAQASDEPRLLAKKAYEKASLSTSVSNLAGLPAHSAKELVDASGRRLVMYVSDCRSSLWRRGLVHEWLQQWSRSGPTAVLQLLPDRLWAESELDVGVKLQVSAFSPGALNDKLRVHMPSKRSRPLPSHRLTLPIVTLTPGALHQWAKVITAAGKARSPARLFDLDWVNHPERSSRLETIQPKSAQVRVELFRATASEIAQQLAGMMAAVPVDMAVVNMIQQELLSAVEPVHIAEVFDSGLLMVTNPTRQAGEPARYEFVKDVRGLLNLETPVDETINVMQALSQRIARKLGFNIKSFTALLSPKSYWQSGDQAEILPFAQVATAVLRQLGGEYAELAEAVEADASGKQGWISPPEGQDPVDETFPSLETLSFEYGELIEAEEDSQAGFPPLLKTAAFQIATISLPQQSLEIFEFQTAKIEQARAGIFRRLQWVVKKSRAQAQRFVEPLSDDLTLEMVAIPGGTFLMGAPRRERERSLSETPQHEVTVLNFFIGRYPVTQLQWRFVARLPQVNRRLNADPSRFKGARLPVESVSWYEAMEFCDRLSIFTGRSYRLPTEAEWEYACRAGTRTPFHYGDTILAEVANYDGNFTYANGPKDKMRGKTTSINEFDVANAFGLSDMHGNVFEWCQDHWHHNYEGVPTDGSAWLTDDQASRRILRGGSWADGSWDCRSAYRNDVRPDYRRDIIGFRVSCSVSGA